MTGHDTWRDQIAAAEAEWCTGELKHEGPIRGSRPCSRDYARADAVMPILDAAVDQARAETARVRGSIREQFARTVLHHRDATDLVDYLMADLAATTKAETAKAETAESHEVVARIRGLMDQATEMYNAGGIRHRAVSVHALRRALGDDTEVTP